MAWATETPAHRGTKTKTKRKGRSVKSGKNGAGVALLVICFYLAVMWLLARMLEAVRPW